MSRSPLRRALPGALLGLATAAVAVTVADIVAALTRAAASPVYAVGGVVIDATPTPLKEYAVRTLGTYDKVVLLAVICVALAAVAAVAGVLAVRRPLHGLATLAGIGALGVAAALSRPAATPADAVPTVAGTLAGALVMVTALRVRGARLPGAVAPTRGPSAPARRVLLLTAAVAVASSVAGLAAADVIRWVRAVGSRSRDAVRLPAPASPAPPLPGGSDLRLPELSAFTTGNADFYRVDTALTVPQVDAEAWRLRVHGMVASPRAYRYPDLLAMPLIERDITLNCVSNEVGGPYIGHARWLGVRLADLLREAGPAVDADQVVSRSVDGMTIGTPTATILDGRDSMLAVGMNGEPLPLEHGFPVRMLVPGLYGYVSACKWLTDLELARFADFDAYWVRRGWAARAAVKTASRIDTPRPFARLAAGPVVVAGVAWAQHRGITAVQVQIDRQDWRPAQLAPVPSADTWRQWRYVWHASAGDHTLRVRATDGTGETQPEDRRPPFPDGATGWHQITVAIG